MDYTDVLLGNYIKHAFRHIKPPEDGRKRLFCAVTNPGQQPKQSRSWHHRIHALLSQNNLAAKGTRWITTCLWGDDPLTIHYDDIWRAYNLLPRSRRSFPRLHLDLINLILRLSS
jgi:hypothetical protein